MQADEVIAKFKKAGEEESTRPSALWDWFDLGLVRYDNAAGLAAGKLLSQGCPTIRSLSGHTSIRSAAVSGRPASETSSTIKCRGQGHNPAAAGSRARPRDLLLPPLRARRPELAEAQTCKSSSRS